MMGFSVVVTLVLMVARVHGGCQSCSTSILSNGVWSCSGGSSCVCVADSFPCEGSSPVPSPVSSPVTSPSLTPCPDFVSGGAASQYCSGSFSSNVRNGYGTYSCSSCIGTGVICPSLPCPAPGGTTCPFAQVSDGSCSSLSDLCAKGGFGPLTKADTTVPPAGTYECFGCVNGQLEIAEKPDVPIPNGVTNVTKVKAVFIYVGFGFAMAVVSIGFAWKHKKSLFRPMRPYSHPLATLCSGPDFVVFLSAIAISFALSVAFESPNIATEIVESESSCFLSVSSTSTNVVQENSQTSSISLLDVESLGTSLLVLIVDTVGGGLMSYAISNAKATTSTTVDDWVLVSIKTLAGTVLVLFVWLNAYLDLDEFNKANNSTFEKSEIFQKYAAVFALSTFLSWVIIEPLKICFFKMLAIPSSQSSQIGSVLEKTNDNLKYF